MAESAPFAMDDDYYGTLNVPRTIGYSGLQTAYARLADDLAVRMAVDPTARDELIRLNRAFGVLGNSDLRRQYDQMHFAEEIEAEEKAAAAEDGKGRRSSNMLFAALIVIVAVQVAVVGYVGRGEWGDMIAAIMNSLTPGGAS